MSIESRRSPERVGDELRERLHGRDRRERPIVVTPAADTGSATPDTDAIEAARVRALAAGVAATEEQQEKDRPIFNFVSRALEIDKAVGNWGLQMLGSGLVIAGFLGYQTSRPVLFTAAHALDWIGRKMNKWADKLVDKKLPILNWLLNPVISFLDSSAKKLGLDKTLAEHLKKHKQDRKKLAEKVFKEYLATQTKAEKKADDAAEKKKRRKVIEDKFGLDVADAIEADVDAAAAAASLKTDSVPVATPAAEAPKTK